MLQKCNVLSVSGVFFIEPTKDHYLREISKKAHLSHTSTKVHLQTLVKLSIIERYVEKKGERKFPLFRAKIDSRNYKNNKKMYNHLQLQNSGLIEFLQDSLMPRSIVLFGSYQRGEDVENSDIDLFIECKEETIDISKFAKILNRNIQLHFKEHFKQYPNELKNNIINGAVLEGYLEAFK